MDKPDVRTLVYQGLGIAQTVEMDSLIDILIDDVIIDILMKAELELSIVENTLVTSAATDNYNLPVGFSKPSKIWKADRVLRRLSPGQYWEKRSVYTSDGEPWAYSIMGRDTATGQRQVYVLPQANGIYTYNLAFYALSTIVDITKIPAEYHLLIVSAVKLQLVPDKDPVTGQLNSTKAFIKNEYDGRLKAILGLENRVGDDPIKAEVGKAVKLKNAYTLKPAGNADIWPGLFK